ncbi:MAG: tetratricopeptide repeat protein, partial [Candidatus Nitrosocosmicus sp.]
MFIAKDETSGYVLPIQTILEKFSSNILGSTIDNQDNPFYLEKGNKHYYEREYYKALSYYDEIIKDSTYLSALSNKGRVYVQLGRTTEAIDLFNFVLSIDTNFVFALIGMGFVLSTLGNYEEAIKWYDKALAINPNDTFALNNKGLALDRLGKHEEAIKWYDKARLLKQNHADIVK